MPGRVAVCLFASVAPMMMISTTTPTARPAISGMRSESWVVGYRRGSYTSKHKFNQHCTVITKQSVKTSAQHECKVHGLNLPSTTILCNIRLFKQALQFVSGSFFFLFDSSLCATYKIDTKNMEILFLLQNNDTPPHSKV